MIKTENFAKVEIADSAELWDWLEQNHAQEDSVWLVTFLKSEGAKYVGREAVLDALVSYGWIDGIRRKLDSARSMQLISPRRTQYWAKSYKDRAAKLQQDGRMQPAGERSIEAGKSSGLWSFMDDVDALIVPGDLEAALRQANGLSFHDMAPSYRRNVLRWIKLAKTDATRAKRIDTAANLAAKGQKVPQM